MRAIDLVRRDEGFALVEALIALAVAGLVSSAAASATILMRHLHDKAEHRRELMDQTVGAARLIRSVVENALPDVARPQFESVAGRHEARFYSTGPDSLLLARPQHLRLHVVESEGKSDLRMSWQDAMSGEAYDEAVLTGARTISFAYFGLVDERGTRAWKNDWLQPRSLPDGILVQFDIPELGTPVDVVVKTTGALPASCLLLPHEEACRDAGL